MLTRPVEDVSLWVHPHSSRRLRSSALATMLRDVIREGDPGATPRAHQVRSYSSSVAFVRTFDLAGVRVVGRWRSPRAFVHDI